MGAFPGSENPAFSGGRQSGLDSNKSESSSDERGVDRLLQEGRNSLLQNPTIARHTDDRGVNISEIDAGQKDVQFDAWREARKQKGKLIGDLNSADSQFKGRSPDPGHESRRIDLEYKERTAREAVFAGLKNLSKEELAEIKRILPDLFHEQIGDRDVRAARMRGYLFDCMLNLDESRMQSMRKELANHPGLISDLASWKIAKDKLKADLSPAELENLTRRRDEISKLNQIAGQSDSANLQLMTMPDLGDSRGKPGETRRAYNKYGDAIDVSYDQSGIATQFKFTLGREHAREEFESLPGNKGKFNEEVYRDFARSADGELKWDASKKEFVYSGGQIGREFFDVRNDRGSDFNRVFFERTTASTEKPASPLNPKSQPDSRPITETAPRTPAGNDQSSKLSMPPIQSLQDLSRNVGPRVLRLDDAGTSTRAGAERRVSLSSPSGNLQSANVRDKRELLSSFSPPKLLPLSSFGTKDIRSNSDPSSSRLDNQTRKITSMETPEPQGQMREFRPPVNSSGNQWGRSIGNGYEQASRIDHFDRAASGSRQLHGHSYDLSPNFQSGAALTSARQDREQQSENSKVWGRTGSGNDGRRMRSAVSGDSKFEERTKGFADSRSIRTGTFDGRGDRIGLGGRKDLIDKVNGPIQRGIGAGTRIILIGPARVLDGIKGGGKTVKSGGEIKGIEGKGGKSGADGKAGVTDGRSGRSSAAARLLKLENLRDKTLKLPSETKSQAVKIVDLLLLNPKERIDGKSKPLADALRQLNSRELNIVRMILQQGLKTDFSRFSEKFQSQLLVVFKILLESDYKYRSLNRRLNSPVLADTSSNRELRIVKKPISADPISEQLEVRRREDSLLTRRLTQTRAISAELIGRVKPIPVADSTINFSEHANADEQKNPVDVEYELLNPIDTSLYLDSLRRLGKASNGAVSEQLGPGVRIIASDCFRVDEQGIRISLKLNFEGVWHTVCQYEIYSTDAVRWQFKRNANPVKMKLTLPALQLGAMARREFRSNWRTLCNSYLGLASNAF